MVPDTQAYRARCSVVVSTRDRPRQLAACLHALEKQRAPRFDVVVVDNAPATLEARDVCQARGVNYLVEPRPGMSRARNAGARASSTEIVAFLDDDAVPEPDWLERLHEPFADPRTGAVSGRILPFPPESAAEELLALHGGCDGGPQPRIVDRETPAWLEIALFGGLGSGGNLAIRQRVFEALGGFDERLGRGTPLHGGEDNYALFSVVTRGHKVVYAPGAVVRHPSPRTRLDLRARQLKDLAAATGFFTFLLAEATGHRGAVLKYLAEGAVGKRRTWRIGTAVPPLRLVSRPRRVLALAQGPLLYLRSQALPRAAAPVAPLSTFSRRQAQSES